jgi:hypothetical protein
LNTSWLQPASTLSCHPIGNATPQGQLPSALAEADAPASPAAV